MTPNTTSSFLFFLTPPGSVPPRLQHFYFFSTYGYGAGALLHIFFCVYLVEQKMLPLAGACGALAVCFSVGAVLNIRGHLKAGMLLVVFGQCVQAWASVYISGFTGFHHYLIPLMVLSLLYPARHKLQGVILAVLVSLEYVALTHIAPLTIPACLTIFSDKQHPQSCQFVYQSVRHVPGGHILRNCHGAGR